MKKHFLLIALLSVSVILNAQIWTRQNLNFPSIAFGADQISIVDSNIVWVKGVDVSTQRLFCNEFTKTSNGGTTWTAGTFVGSNANILLTGLAASSATTAFGIAVDTVEFTSSFWKTTDGGANWDSVSNIFINNPYPDGVRFWDKDKGFCYGDPVDGEFDIYTTADGGATWSKVPGANISDPTDINEWSYNYFSFTCVAPGGIGFFLTNGGRLFKTINYGANWTVAATSPFDSIPSSGSAQICASGADYIIVANFSSTLGWDWQYTADGGTTWQTFLPASGTYYQYQMCYVPESPGMFVSTGPYSTSKGVAFSTDGGMNWTDFADTTLQPFGAKTACLGVNFYNMNIGWVGNFDSIHYNWRFRANCTSNSATSCTPLSALNWSVYSAANCAA